MTLWDLLTILPAEFVVLWTLTALFWQWWDGQL